MLLELSSNGEDPPIEGDPVLVVERSEIFAEFLRERTHDDSLVGGRGNGLEVVGEEQIQQNVPQLPRSRIVLLFQPLCKTPRTGKPGLPLRSRQPRPTHHHSNEEDQFLPSKCAVRHARVPNTELKGLVKLKRSVGKRLARPLPDLANLLALRSGLHRTRHREQVHHPEHFRRQLLRGCRCGRQLALQLLEEAPLSLLQVLYEVLDEIPEILRCPHMLIGEHRTITPQAAVPPAGGCAQNRVI